MISFGVELGLLAVRVTIVALAALGLLLACRRCGARSAVVFLAGAMVILLILPATAFLPVPDDWRWALIDDVPAAGSASVATPQGATETPAEGVAASSLLGTAARWLVGWEGVAPTPARLWGWTIVANLYLLALCACAFRLLLEWRGLATLRRRSRGIADPELLELADELRRRLGYAHPVELRESDDIGPAATLGWLRPVILLAADWRSWTNDERRAVLAHELAHVRHRDFALRVLAGLCRVLHFYHPLVRWLTRHMQWRQEVAADDLAATLTGGRPAYLKTLARLALRLPARMPVGASLSLPAITGGTLVRRIDMLYRTEQRPMHPTWRGLLIVLLAVPALVVSTWRGPAETAHGDAPADEIEPFELGYLPPEAKGIVAARPSTWVRQPGLDKVREQIDDAFKKLKEEGIDLPAILKPHNIEQFVGNLHLTTAGTGKPGSRSMQVGTSSFLIRFHKELDAPALLRPLVPDMKETRKGDMTICHLGTIPVMGPQPVSMLVPDRRTVVFLLHNLKDDDEAAAKHIDTVLARIEATRKRDWGSGWKKVERAPLAVVVDNCNGSYQKTFAKDLEEAPELQTMLDNLRFATLGVELGDGKPMRVVLDAISPSAAKVLEKASMTWLRKELSEVLKEAVPNELAEKARLKWSTELLTLGKTIVNESRVEWVVYPSVRIHDLIGPDGFDMGSAAK